MLYGSATDKRLSIECDIFVENIEIFIVLFIFCYGYVRLLLRANI